MTQPSNPNDVPPFRPGQRSIEVDMSPEAIELRLREVGELHKLWESLRQFKLVDETPKPDPPLSS